MWFLFAELIVGHAYAGEVWKMKAVVTAIEGGVVTLRSAKETCKVRVDGRMESLKYLMEPDALTQERMHTIPTKNMIRCKSNSEAK